MVLLNRKEKEGLVIKLAKEEKTYREVAKVVHISPIEIKKIIDKATGDGNSQSEQSEKEKQQKPKSHYAQEFQMFWEKKSLKQVVVELGINALTVFRYYEDYLTLKRMDILLKYIQKFSKIITGIFSIIFTER